MNNLASSATNRNNNQNAQRKYKVLMVAGFLRGHEGITSHIATLAKGLQEKGWEIGLACGLETEERNVRGIKWLESQGIKYYFLPFTPSSSMYSLRTLKVYQQLQSAIKQFQPDIIHSHAFSVAPFLQIVKLTKDLPVVSTCHMNPKVKSKSLSTKLGSLMNRYLNPNFLGDRTIAISQEVQKSYRDILHIREENIRLIYHGMDETYFYPPSSQERLDARLKLGLQENTKVVCIIGRLSPFKGHKVLFRAVEYLQERGVKLVVLCAGTGQQEQELNDYSQKLGITDSIKMLGFADARQTLWASDVIVLPSKREALPLVICEAMLCGVVPIRTPASGAFDQIDDRINGFIFPFDDSETLANRLQQLLQDDKLKQSMSFKALASAQQKFTIKQMVTNTISVYQELLNN